jgi:hypothetical protein
MTKAEHIEYRRGRAAFRAGAPYVHTASHAWKMGFIDAEQAAKRAA